MTAKSIYGGMTVNERLYVSELINKYNAAIKVKDIGAAISILKKVDLGFENIKANLKFDGFSEEQITKNLF